MFYYHDNVDRVFLERRWEHGSGPLDARSDIAALVSDLNGALVLTLSLVNTTLRQELFVQGEPRLESQPPHP